MAKVESGGLDMIKGLYAAASAMLAGLNRQTILSHNVANLNTPGFKQILNDMTDFINNPVVHPLNAQSQPLRYLGQLGLGVQTGPESSDFTAGGFQNTDQPLDLAIQGNGFFHTKTSNGDRYTRDGRFDRDAQGNLVTVDGNFVLDDKGAQIKLPQGQPVISTEGVIYVNGARVAQLGLGVFVNPAKELVRDQPNTFIAAAAPTGKEKVSVAQGYLEMSNVNPAAIMTQMVSVSRAYEAAQQLVQNQDNLLGETINTLGKV
jgi:flagellar basal body rod protein FlgG